MNALGGTFAPARATALRGSARKGSNSLRTPPSALLTSALSSMLRGLRARNEKAKKPRGRYGIWKRAGGGLSERKIEY